MGMGEGEGEVGGEGEQINNNWELSSLDYLIAWPVAVSGTSTSVQALQTSFSLFSQKSGKHAIAV